MKKFILAALVAAFSFSASAQKSTAVKLSGGVYVNASDSSRGVAAVNTGKLYVHKGVKYPIWKSARGKFFVNVVPASGRAYKKYLAL